MAKNKRINIKWGRPAICQIVKAKPVQIAARVGFRRNLRMRAKTSPALGYSSDPMDVEVILLSNHKLWLCSEGKWIITS